MTEMKKPVRLGSPEYQAVYDSILNYFNGDQLAADVLIGKYLHRDNEFLYETSPEDLFNRLTDEFVRIEQKYPNPLSRQEIYDLLKDFKKLVMAGSPMAGIGINMPVSLSNCYVLDNVQDSYAGILKNDEEQAQISKRRGGCGYDVSNLRRENAPVNNSAMSSSGGVTFMERFSNTTKEVGQHNRRGALLLSCSVKSPFAQDFLNAKTDNKSVSGANISLKLDNEFMHAVEHNEMYKQHWEYANGYVEDVDINASKFFANIVENAWAHAEPGILFWDTVMKWSNGRSYGPKYTEVSSNPCFTGDTLLLTKDGYRTFEELAKEWNFDKQGYHVTLLNKDGEQCGGTVWSNGFKHVIKLVFNNKSYIECTPNHKFMLQDGTECEASSLIGKIVKGFDGNDAKCTQIIDDDKIKEVFDFNLNGDCHWGIVGGLIAHNCCVATTPVMLANGTTKTIKELADAGDDVDVMCFNDEREVVIRTMRHPRLTGHNEPIYKITFDSGDTIRVTGNHKFLTTDNQYVEAKDLKYGDSLAIITRTHETFDKFVGYKTNSKSQLYSVIDNHCFGYHHDMEHRMIARHYDSNFEHNKVVHHIDGNALNNDKSNLQCMSKQEHNALHAQEKCGLGNPIYKIKANPERFAEYSAKMSESTRGEKNGRYAADVEFEDIIAKCVALSQEFNRCISEKEWNWHARHGEPKCVWSPFRYRQVIAKYGNMQNFFVYCAKLANVSYPEVYSTDSKVIKTAHKMLNNGYEIRIVDNKYVQVKRICEHCGQEFWQPWCQREVSFCSTECGLLHKNVQYTTEQLQLYTELKQKHGGFTKVTWNIFSNECNVRGISCELPTSWNDFRHFATTYNHRVQSVEFDGYEDVYNGTVDQYHNFFVGAFESETEDGFKQFTFLNNKQCGEQCLPAYSSCMLLHVNLSNYVINAWSSNAYVAFEALDRDVRKIVRIADDFNDLEQEAIQRILNKIASDPESEEVKYRELHLWQHIQEMLINCRRYGLGFMGLGDVFAKIGVTYGTQESINIAEQIQSTMTIACYETSIELAKERGSFPIFDKAKDLQSNFVQHVLEHVDAEHLSMYHEHGRRNMYCNCVAPTGSTAIMTQTTSGIEPVFMPISKRRRKQTVMDSDDKVTFVDDATGEKFIEYIVVHQPLLEWMMKCVSFEFNDANSIIDFTVHKPIVIDINTDRCNQFKTLLLNLSADLRQQIFKASPYYKSTTEDVDWLGKVELQGAIQKWVDNAISVTINIPNSSTRELVHDIYMTAWKSGCKGCTIYRDGSRSGVLVSVDNNANNAKSNAKSNSYVLANGKRSKRKPVLPAQIYTFRIKGEYWCIFIGIDNGKPYEVFAFKPTEDEFNQLQQMVDNDVTTTITKVKKKVYRLGDNCSFIKAYNDIIKRFDMDEQQTITRLYSTMLRNGVGLDEIVDQTEKSTANLSSFCKAIGRALKTFIAEGTSLYEKCPQCGGDLVKFDGCTRCKNCGFSKCG